MADYPSSIWTPPVRGTNMSDTVTQTDILEAQNEEIVAIETTLGTAPLDGYASLKARLRAMGSTVAAAFTPAANTDASVVGGGNNWVTLTSALAVPTWCSSAVIIMTAGSVHSISAASTYTLTTKIGATNATSNHVASWGATGDRRSFTWTSTVSAPATGSQTLVVHAERTAGTGQARADTLSRFSASVTFFG